MNDLPQKILLEGIKPSSGFISALLESKIEKVKKWVKDREINESSGSKNLPKIIESYLTKISHRVSEVTTITFPQLKINIDEVYEPLKVERKYLYNEKEKRRNSFISFQETFEKKGAFLIIDNAGMGKSTYSKFLVTNILIKSHRIPVLYELRKINKKDSLIENISKELDCPGQMFSRDLFYLLLKKGKFVIILDGFDEVDIEYQVELANQIHDLSINGEKNTLIVTSRPQDIIPDLLHGESYKFKKFTINQAKSLILRYDKIGKINIGKKLIKELDNVPENFTETPLLVSLLYRTFGVNGSIADRICTFYDEIYQALYKGHDLINKNGYLRQKKSNLDFEDFRKVLRALCYFMSVNRVTSFEIKTSALDFIDKAYSLALIEEKNASSFLDDLLVAVPIMYMEGTEFKFLHKTILEFFAAEYLVYHDNSLDIANKLFTSRISGSFDGLFTLLYDIKKSLYEKVVTKYFSERIIAHENKYMHVNKKIKNALFFNTVYIGLWEVGNIQEMTSKRENLEQPATLKQSAYEYSIMYWDVSVNKKDMMLSFATINNYNNFYKPSIVDLSSELVLEKGFFGKEIKQVDHSFVDLLSVNKWRLLDHKTVKQFTSEESIVNVLSTMGANNKLLSLEKATASLKRINRDIKLQEEMDMLVK